MKGGYGDMSNSLREVVDGDQWCQGRKTSVCTRARTRILSIQFFPAGQRSAVKLNFFRSEEHARYGIVRKSWRPSSGRFRKVFRE
eukprot:scaffold1785_cov247-Pinguiococcus_pyrenoidosus.AAC.30